MPKIKETKAAKGQADRGDIRTLQALDQAAGGSGDVASDSMPTMPTTQNMRPTPGTDDARCEDSAEGDERRKQDFNEAFFRTCDLWASAPSKPYPDDATLSQAPADQEASSENSRRKPERADAEIREEIEGRLKADRLLDATGIFVSVSHGRVMIEGSVENHEAKQRAEVISRQASGIVGHDTSLAVRKAR